MCGLPVSVDPETGGLMLGASLNRPSWCVRKLHDLDVVWNGDVGGEDRVIYRYTDGLHLPGEDSAWASAGVIYGIVSFPPGIFGGEFVKSSGQYHPPLSPSGMAAPEIYTVLSGVGHFLLQKARPPYDVIEDVVLVEAQAGETLVVPPDYGHLQINPGSEPLVFSYTVMNGLKGDYSPFRRRRGAVYYEMAEGPDRYVFNPRYDSQLPLRIMRAADLHQIPGLNGDASYPAIRDRLPEMGWLTDPTAFVASAGLQEAVGERT